VNTLMNAFFRKRREIFYHLSYKKESAALSWCFLYFIDVTVLDSNVVRACRSIPRTSSSISSTP
jgi:hypothetical protein